MMEISQILQILQILIEAIVVGISTILMGLLVHYLFGYHAKHAHSKHMKQEMIDLSVTLFFTGFFLHLLFEFTGLNSKYCKTGHACRKK